MSGRAGNRRAAGPVDKKVGARIRARRLEIAMSQETLAGKLGITFQQVQKYKKGANRVSVPVLLELSKALKAPVLSLLPAQAAEEGTSLLDNPELAAFVPLLLDLNDEGRRTLAVIARAFAKEAKLSRTPT